jgi:hypothetical protein
MDGKIAFRIIAALVLIAAIAGVAFFAFNAGVATHVQVPATGNGQMPYPYYGYGFWHPFPFFGFGCFAPLIGLFLLFIALRAFSFLFWGPRWGHWGQMHRAGRRGWGEEGGVPPMFQEWHNRAHGQPGQPGDEKKD